LVSVADSLVHKETGTVSTLDEPILLKESRASTRRYRR
jgi:hypothetical protein